MTTRILLAAVAAMLALPAQAQTGPYPNSWMGNGWGTQGTAGPLYTYPPAWQGPYSGGSRTGTGTAPPSLVQHGQIQPQRRCMTSCNYGRCFSSCR
jgi:hypothetical protein